MNNQEIEKFALQIEERSKRGSREKFLQVMAKVPKVQPEQFDSIEDIPVKKIIKVTTPAKK